MSATPTVIMYTMQTCTYCARAKKILSEYGMTPEEIVIDADPARILEVIEELMQKTGKRSVPQIFIGERYVGGYDDLAALHQSGELKILLG